MSTTDKAAEIRQALKAKHGWTSRDISVRAEYFSLGSSIHVVVKNPVIPLSTVKAIAEAAEVIRRCEITGDILGGGNRYVDVNYSNEAAEVLTAQFLTVAEAAVAEMQRAGDNQLIPVKGTPYMVGRSYNGWGVAIWDHTSHQAEVMDAQGVARWIGFGGAHN